MDFNHTDDRRMFAETIAKFVSENYDYLTRNEISVRENGYSSEIWQQFAELGAIGALFDESIGGYGGDGFDIAVVFEELGKAIVVEPFLANLVAGTLLAQLGNEQQREKIEEVISGQTTLAFAHSEAQGGYETSYVATTATSTDKGAWSINGHKSVAFSADSADMLVVSARSAGNVDDQDGISTFFIDPKTPGVTITGYGTVDGYRAADVRFDNVTVEESSLLGAAGESFAAVQSAQAVGTLAVCAEALGAMQSCVMITNEFIKTRKQFGVPIGKFQVLQHRMAEMLIELEQVRSAVINAAGHMSSDLAERQWYLSAAKNLIGRVGKLVAEETIQMHGGIGMTWEYSIAHFAKRLVMIDHIFGDEDFHLGKIVNMAK